MRNRVLKKAMAVLICASMVLSSMAPAFGAEESTAAEEFAPVEEAVSAEDEAVVEEESAAGALDTPVDEPQESVEVSDSDNEEVKDEDYLSEDIENDFKEHILGKADEPWMYYSVTVNNSYSDEVKFYSNSNLTEAFTGEFETEYIYVSLVGAVNEDTVYLVKDPFGDIVTSLSNDCDVQSIYYGLLENGDTITVEKITKTAFTIENNVSQYVTLYENISWDGEDGNKRFVDKIEGNSYKYIPGSGIYIVFSDDIPEGNIQWKQYYNNPTETYSGDYHCSSEYGYIYFNREGLEKLTIDYVPYKSFVVENKTDGKVALYSDIECTNVYTGGSISENWVYAKFTDAYEDGDMFILESPMYGSQRTDKKDVRLDMYCGNLEDGSTITVRMAESKEFTFSVDPGLEECVRLYKKAEETIDPESGQTKMEFSDEFHSGDPLRLYSKLYCVLSDDAPAGIYQIKYGKYSSAGSYTNLADPGDKYFVVDIYESFFNADSFVISYSVPEWMNKSIAVTDNSSGAVRLYDDNECTVEFKGKLRSDRLYAKVDPAVSNDKAFQISCPGYVLCTLSDMSGVQSIGYWDLDDTYSISIDPITKKSIRINNSCSKYVSLYRNYEDGEYSGAIADSADLVVGDRIYFHLSEEAPKGLYVFGNDDIRFRYDGSEYNRHYEFRISKDVYLDGCLNVRVENTVYKNVTLNNKSSGSVKVYSYSSWDGEKEFVTGDLEGSGFLRVKFDSDTDKDVYVVKTSKGIVGYISESFVIGTIYKGANSIIIYSSDLLDKDTLTIEKAEKAVYRVRDEGSAGDIFKLYSDDAMTREVKRGDSLIVGNKYYIGYTGEAGAKYKAYVYSDNAGLIADSWIGKDITASFVAESDGEIYVYVPESTKKTGIKIKKELGTFADSVVLVKGIKNAEWTQTGYQYDYTEYSDGENVFKGDNFGVALSDSYEKVSGNSICVKATFLYADESTSVSTVFPRSKPGYYKAYMGESLWPEDDKSEQIVSVTITAERVSYDSEKSTLYLDKAADLKGISYTVEYSEDDGNTYIPAVDGMRIPEDGLLRITSEGGTKDLFAGVVLMYGSSDDEVEYYKYHKDDWWNIDELKYDGFEREEKYEWWYPRNYDVAVKRYFMDGTTNTLDIAVTGNVYLYLTPVNTYKYTVDTTAIKDKSLKFSVEDEYGSYNPEGRITEGTELYIYYEKRSEGEIYRLLYDYTDRSGTARHESWVMGGIYDELRLRVSSDIKFTVDKAVPHKLTITGVPSDYSVHMNGAGLYETTVTDGEYIVYEGDRISFSYDGYGKGFDEVLRVAEAGNNKLVGYMVNTTKFSAKDPYITIPAGDSALKISKVSASMLTVDASNIKKVMLFERLSGKVIAAPKTGVRYTGKFDPDTLTSRNYRNVYLIPSDVSAYFNHKWIDPSKEVLVTFADTKTGEVVLTKTLRLDDRYCEFTLKSDAVLTSEQHKLKERALKVKNNNLSDNSKVQVRKYVEATEYEDIDGEGKAYPGQKITAKAVSVADNKKLIVKVNQTGTNVIATGSSQGFVIDSLKDLIFKMFDMDLTLDIFEKDSKGNGKRIYISETLSSGSEVNYNVENGDKVDAGKEVKLTISKVAANKKLAINVICPDQNLVASGAGIVNDFSKPLVSVVTDKVQDVTFSMPAYPVEIIVYEVSPETASTDEPEKELTPEEIRQQKIQQVAEAAAAGFGSVEDTIKVTRADKKNYISFDSTVSENIVTIIKGNKLVINDPQAVEGSFNTSDKKTVKINKKGVIKAMKPGTVTISYLGDSDGKKECQIKVNVIAVTAQNEEGSEGNITFKKMKGTTAVGSQYSMVISLPINATYEIKDKKGVMGTKGTDYIQSFTPDGKIEFKGTAKQSGTATIIFNVYGTKVKVKLKAEKQK